MIKKEGHSLDLLKEFWENGEKYLKDGEFKEYFNFLKEQRKKDET